MSANCFVMGDRVKPIFDWLGWKKGTVTEGGCHNVTLKPDGWNTKVTIDAGSLEKLATEPSDPCYGIICNPTCVGVDRYSQTCQNGVCTKGILLRRRSPDCGYVAPVCTEGDKKPGYICSEGKWVPYTPEQEAGRLYVKFDIPWLDLLPGIPYEPWMIMLPGFKIVEEKQ